MNEWAHLAPVVLTDSMFFEYVPSCHSTGTASQRQHAYLMAEQQMIQHLQTPLLPTIITGTYIFPVPYRPLMLPYSYIQSVNRIVVTSVDDQCTCALTENDACAVIRDGFGLVDFRVLETNATSLCGCNYPDLSYYQAKVTYTAGLTTGTAANDTSLHFALSVVAEINLNEIVDPGSNEGGPGDPGIQQWGSLGYSEQRMPLGVFPFGSSPRANYAARLVRHLKRMRPLRL